MLKVVDVCTRVEGHGNVKIFLQNDEINFVDFEISAFRGFEKILIGKKLIDAPRIVSRICGLCHASQMITSCKTIEDLYDYKVSEQTSLLRRLIMTGELIKSHSMHFFFQSFPDLLQIFNETKSILDPYELIKFDPQLTTYLYDLVKFGNEIDNIFGGRSVHTINPIAGGVIYNPHRKHLLTAKKYFQKALENLEYVIDKFINLFALKTPPPEFNLPDPYFLGLHNYGKYDRHQGLLRIKETGNKPFDFQAQNYKRYFDTDLETRGITFNLNSDKNVLVGPIARRKLIESYEVEDITAYFKVFNKKWKNSILFANFLKLIEMYVESKQALEILESPILTKRENLESLQRLNNNEGYGIVEAPRGTLIHYYKVNEQKVIEDIRLIIATEINIPLINYMITEHAKVLYDKTGDLNMIKKALQKIIRAFDPCIACATH